MTEERDRKGVTSRRDVRAEIRHHRDLQVWNEAMTLVRDVYQMTATFPKEEAFGLAAQMRRAAVSVPSNIAEGAGRGSRAEFRQFLFVARGSLAELETQFLIARDLGYLRNPQSMEQKISQILLLLNGLTRAIATRSSPRA